MLARSSDQEIMGTCMGTIYSQGVVELRIISYLKHDPKVSIENTHGGNITTGLIRDSWEVAKRIYKG